MWWKHYNWAYTKCQKFKEQRKILEETQIVTETVKNKQKCCERLFNFLNKIKIISVLNIVILALHIALLWSDQKYKSLINFEFVLI